MLITFLNVYTDFTIIAFVDGVLLAKSRRVRIAKKKLVYP